MTVTQDKQIKAPGVLAQRYGRAFFAYLQEHCPDSEARRQVLAQVRGLQAAVLETPSLQTFLRNPRLGSQAPGQVAAQLAEGMALGDEARRLIGVVAREGRLPMLAEILEAVLREDAKARDEVSVDVCTARPLNRTQREKLRKSLHEAGYPHVSMTEHVDPALIGGMTVRVGPVLFDTSISGRLTRLQHAMKGAA